MCVYVKGTLNFIVLVVIDVLWHLWYKELKHLCGYHSMIPFIKSP